MEEHAKALGDRLGFAYILQNERMSGRLRGYKPGAPVMNISGSVVSAIDEERLRKPLKPSQGEFLIAIRGKPNPRSNGITALRKRMIELLGNDWHETELGKMFLEYLSAPSTVFYPVFRDLISKGLVSSVYHMSGGAYNGKLARPISKHNLIARIGYQPNSEIQDLFHPDWRHLALSHGTPMQNAYGKWPMGNDGFVAVAEENTKEVLKVLESYGLEARVVGKFEAAEAGRTGVELKAFNGETVYFSGKD
jgi:phosphoribosylaminoimidazole (AIR) synthetase